VTAAAPARAGNSGEGPLTHRQIQTVYAGLMLAMLVASLDQTIVATALPTIVGSLGGFGGLGHLAWVGTAYLVTSTSAAVVYGKVSDLHGRKRVFQSALVVFLAGSALAGAARSLDQLIAFRAIQGIGGGGIMALTTAVVADMVPPRRRGRYVGYVGGVLALATVAGPLLGGFLVDHLTWRWIFYVNLPIGAAAFAVIGVVLRLPPARRATGRRMDYPGAVLLVTAVTCGVLVASWGGVEAPWSSPRIIGLGAAAALALAGFALVERRARDPLLPLDLFRDPVIAITSAVGCIAGVVLFGAIVFLPLFLQVAKGATATSSGLLILPLMLGVLVASIATGRLVTRSGRYKPFPIAGGALMTVAFWLLSLLRAGTPTPAIVAEMALLGIGIGLLMPVLVVAAQNAASHRHLGLVTSLAQFFRELGGTFGVALFGAVFASRLAAELGRRLPAGSGGTAGARALAAAPQGSPAALRGLPAPVHQAVVESVARSAANVFHWAIPFTVAALLLTLALRELPLRDTLDRDEPAATPGGAFGARQPLTAPIVKPCTKRSRKKL
jgi:EmrB/QacA subfamily drug resistance transporter